MKDNAKKAIVWLVLSCAILFILKILPIFSGFLLSMKNYTPINGLNGSQLIGLENFRHFLISFPGLSLFVNAIRLNFITAAFTFIISGIYVYFSAQINNRKHTLILTFIFALPALMPRILFAGFALFSMGMKINDYYNIVYPLLESIRLSGYVALFAYFFSANAIQGQSNSKSAAKHTLTVLCIFLLVGLSKFLSSDFELANAISNPMLYKKSDVLSTYAYRIGFMQINFGEASAVWIIKYLTELITAAAATIGIFVMLKPKKHNEKNFVPKKNDIIPKAICILLAAIMAALCIAVIIPKAQNSSAMKQLNIPYNIIFMLMCLFVSAASAALTSVMAYPFSSKSRTVKIIYSVFLVASLYGTNYILSFVFYKSMRMINTIFPVLLSGFLPIWMIAVYAIYLNSPRVLNRPNNESYVKKIKSPALIAAAVSFSLMWGSYVPTMIYTMDASLFNAAFTIKNLMSVGGQSLGLNLFIFIPILLVWTAIAFVIIRAENKTNTF